MLTCVGLAYSLRPIYTPANAMARKKYLKEAVRLDAKFALSWALLSYVEGSGLPHQKSSTNALRFA